jgi:hypothetical protein
MLVAVVLGFVLKARARTTAFLALAWLFLYPAVSLGFGRRSARPRTSGFSTRVFPGPRPMWFRMP